MRKLRAAVIGIGNMGRYHVRNYAEINEVDLVAVCDQDQSRAHAIAEKYGCTFFTDYLTMLATTKVDIVSIAVPTIMHQRVATDCLENGVHVLLEKPIADNVVAAKALREVAQKNKCKLMIGHIERFNPAVLKLKKMIDANELGVIHSIIARRVGIYPPQIKDANVIVDLAVHELDIVNYLLGQSPHRFEAQGGYALNDHRCDYASILLHYNPASVFVQANWITPVKVRKLNITGIKGYLELDYVTQKITLFESSTEKTTDNFGDFVIRFGQATQTDVYVEQAEPLRSELVHFIECVNHDLEPIVTVDQAIEALDLALKIDAQINGLGE